MKTFYIQTLGCKVNQYESDGIAQELTGQKFKQVKRGQKADIVIVNTCAVTSKAGMQSRQTIRKLIRQHPDSKVIVTGCHSQTEPELVRDIKGVDALICHKAKTKIAQHMNQICVAADAVPFEPVDHHKTARFNSFKHAVTGRMTRPYLKIQDGCNAFCTYCIVPHARGRSVSMPVNEVISHLSELGDKGHNEVILTGIHTGLYGQDLKEKTTLSELVGKINDLKPVQRIRLSSIEPAEITDDLIESAGPGNILCDHFHIPLQSGDDDILKQMKRPYDSSFFEQRILTIRKQILSAGIGVDTLIGFPGETNEQFENTYQLIKRLPVSYLHIFPFSPRKGTPAYHFKNKVEPDIIRQRCEKMRRLDREKRKQFILSQTGRIQKGLVQNKRDEKNNLYTAVTSNYLNIRFSSKKALGGKIIDIIPEQCDDDLNISGRLAHNRTKGSIR